MRVETAESQVWWVALYDEIRPLKVPPTGALLESIQKAFSFLVVPKEVRTGQGIEFQMGGLSTSQGPIAITKLVLFNDGLNIAVPSTTDDADRVLQKALEVASSIGMRKPVTAPSHTYVSNIVADFDCSIDAFFPQSLFDELATIGPEKGAPHVLSIGFQFDPLNLEQRPLAGGNSGLVIERRTGFPYDNNRYFSTANASTQKHIELLQRLERCAQNVRKEAAN